MIDLTDYETNKGYLEAYGYAILPWEDFVAAPDLPKGLLDRALEVTEARPELRQWAVYDPDGDAEDWLLVGDWDEIVRETVEDIIGMGPPTGPLSSAELGRADGSVYR
jgi:hypothetical protein